ncbi:flavodoxin family protein [Cellulomonas xiejunii]|uniref:flavodoxin family protein n=1 Tax=Cellulomonas xiejunii TaxID=2968083 RepID=UPI001D0E6466|nr:flavodoxin domain-containing protein [Cellulomonas xiejunii]MCC2314670.1 flavodoxin domain-containing protein [Cellulomonas xiejunii]
MLHIYYATDTGNAEIAAHTLGQRLGESSAVVVHDLGTRTPDDIGAADGVSLFICASCDEGQVPEHARDTFDALSTGGHDLTGIHFLAVGLGDSVYRDTYNHGCRRLVSALELNGARLLGEPYLHDASDGSDPVTAVEDWYRTVADALLAVPR